MLGKGSLRHRGYPSILRLLAKFVRNNANAASCTDIFSDLNESTEAKKGLDL